MSYEHRRQDEDVPEFHQRASDSDRVVRYGEVIERWFKLFWPLLALIWGVFMVSVWEPLREIPQLHEQVADLALQAKRSAVTDSIGDVERAELRKGQAVTNRILCFNLNQDDRIKYDIDCHNIPLPLK